jgi:hypothetical protein
MILAPDFPLQRWFLGVKMKKWFWLGSLLATGSMGIMPAFARPQIVNPIKSVADINYAGCSISRSDTDTDREWLFYLIDENTARMNINGRDETVRLIKNEDAKGDGKLGDIWTAVYQSGKTQITIVRTTTFLCEAGDEKCEVVRYSAKITAKNGNQTDILYGMGDCGS